MNNCKIKKFPIFEGVKKLKILILEANNNQIENLEYLGNLLVNCKEL